MLIHAIIYGSIFFGKSIVCDWLLIRRIFASCAAGLLTIVEIPFDEKTQTFMSQIGGHFATAPLPQMISDG